MRLEPAASYHDGLQLSHLQKSRLAACYSMATHSATAEGDTWISGGNDHIVDHHATGMNATSELLTACSRTKHRGAESV